MNLKNSNENYGMIAKALHWFTAFLFLGAYISVYYRHWFTDAKILETGIRCNCICPLGYLLVF
jgi:cytochrome b561